MTAMQDIKSRELKDKDSNANTKICFEVRTTALRPRLHTEVFYYIVHTGLPTQGTSTEDLVNTILEYITPLSTNTTSTQEARHNTKHLYT